MLINETPPESALHEVVEISPISRMSDRELLEYIAENMLTTDRVITEITARLPEVLSSLDNSPIARTILKFM